MLTVCGLAESVAIDDGPLDGRPQDVQYRLRLSINGWEVLRT